MLCAFLGPLFDSLGPRTMFACGQTLNAAGLLIPILSQSYWPVFAGWLLFEAAYNIIAPAIQAAMTTAIDDPSRVWRARKYLPSNTSPQTFFLI